MRHNLLSGGLLFAPMPATEFHVALTGDDRQPGTCQAPLRTIQAAADRAQPGDVITVHAGVYRERIDPPRGGESDAKRIIYQAAPGEQVEIKGSEVVTGWQQVQGDVWNVVLPNSFFGAFNPYGDVIRGDWFNGLERTHHTGAVYLNGHWLTEAADLDALLAPAGVAPLWFGQVDPEQTTLWAQLKGVNNPNDGGIEINVRQTVFYPSQPGINYLTVRGFVLRHAATPWAPPTAEQIGLLGTHWSKGWIIENNVISHSRCTGVTLGKHGDEFDNKSEDSAEGYVETITRAVARGWDKERIGHHVVRNNHISHCEQAGLVGSLGAVFSRITGNRIHDIHVQRLFTGAEMAGIKIHAAIDTEVSGNHVHHTILGIWLDWMAQGARVSGNLVHDNDHDLFVEVNHGPFVIDNNIFLSKTALTNWSQGGAYVHNLFGGGIHQVVYDERLTPYHQPHSVNVVGLHDNPNGDDRYYNNLFVGTDLTVYDEAKLPPQMAGNVFLNGAKPSRFETGGLVAADFDPALKLSVHEDRYELEIALDPGWTNPMARPWVTTGLLGKAHISGCTYENADGSPLQIDHDYAGNAREAAQLAAGPFASWASVIQVTL